VTARRILPVVIAVAVGAVLSVAVLATAAFRARRSWQRRVMTPFRSLRRMRSGPSRASYIGRLAGQVIGTATLHAVGEVAKLTIPALMSRAVRSAVSE